MAKFYQKPVGGIVPAVELIDGNRNIFCGEER